MSKQSEAKKVQWYEEKTVPRTCGSCKNYKSERKPDSSNIEKYWNEINKRCAVGGFAVKKTATCILWEPK